MALRFTPCVCSTIYDNQGNPCRKEYIINFDSDNTHFTAKYSDFTRWLTLYHDGNYIASTIITKSFDEELATCIIKSWFEGDNSLARLAGWANGAKKLRF